MVMRKMLAVLESQALCSNEDRRRKEAFLSLSTLFYS